MRGSQDLRFLNDIERLFFRSFESNRNQYYPGMNQNPRYNQSSSNAFFTPSFYPSDFYQDSFFSPFQDYDYDPFLNNNQRNSKAQARHQSNQRQSYNDYDQYNHQNYNSHPYQSYEQKKQEKKPQDTEYYKKQQQKSDKKSTEKPFVAKTEAPKKQEPLLYLPIVFIFEENGGKRFYPFKKTIALATTIEEIQEIVAYNYKISDEIIIKYKNGQNLIPLNSYLTIADISDKIKERGSDGKVLNLMFIEIKSDKKVEAKKPEINKESKRSESSEKVENSPRNIDESKDIKEVVNKEKDTKPKTPSKKPKSIASFKPKIKRIPQDSDEKVEPKKKQQVKKEEEKVDDEPTNGLTKYYFKVNSDDEVLEVELDDEATVKTMKKEIAKMKNVSKLVNIKIIFAGKELLNSIVLKSLCVEDTILFVYIRSEEDVLLLTAKALKIDNNYEYDDDDDENEEEEEEYDD